MRFDGDLDPSIAARTAGYIARTQLPCGAIPWFEGGITDPWDHVEAAMGLSVGGYREAAVAAYRWLKGEQLENGAWLAAYDGHRVVDGTRAESNFVAYIATGLWHHYRVYRDQRFLHEMWPCLTRAVDFVLTLQAPTGEIYWAWDTRTGINKDALITGCSSIYKSLECAILIAQTLQASGPGCAEFIQRASSARQRLGHTLRNHPERFDRTWPSKARYSMDWFYPVLTGVVTGQAAGRRIHRRWDDFVETQLGCRCVSDRPWVTVAETCELTLALLNADLPGARELFTNLQQFQAEDGSWWTGLAWEENEHQDGCAPSDHQAGQLWPDERPTWTAGAILLVIDALYGLTDAADLFTRAHLTDTGESTGELAQHT